MKSIIKFCSIISLIFLFSCSSTEPVGETEAEVLYKDIQTNYKGKRYMLALEKISSFRSKYPYSFYLAEIELLRADIYFEQENYLEAVDAYLTFRDFHPNYKELDQIEWRISESFFKQLPETVDRDISPAISAINSFQDLIRKYPESKNIEKAKERVQLLEQMLEEKELYIADFYYRTNDFQSASYRYQNILKTTRNDETVKKSSHHLIDSLFQLGKKEECLNNLQVYGKFLEKNLMDSYFNKCTQLTEVNI